MTFRILFVCTGNVCRSPAAERLLLAALDDRAIDVTSAGTQALVGEPINSPMAKLVANHGADPEGFSARQLTPTLLQDSDLVLALTSQHRGTVVSQHPAAVQRTFVLGEFANMVTGIEPGDVDVLVGPNADQADRLRTLTTLAKTRRTLGIDPAEDVPDPYGRSASVYAQSFELIVDYLRPVVALVARPD